MNQSNFLIKQCMAKFFILLIPGIILARNWTVMVYIAADNGLSVWADSDIVEMEAVGSDDNLAILVQVDKPNIGARRLWIEKNSSVELQQLGIVDMCSWQTLSDFLYWGIKNFPAQRYLVILWDHGTGWSSPRASFGSDWSSGNEMGIADGEFKKAFSNLYAYTGKEIDLLCFDACLMQEIEVAYEIKEYAKIFLAPQTIMPIQGFRYDKILQVIKDRPGIDEIELAKEMVRINVANYRGVQPLAMSALNLKQLDDFKNKFDALLQFLSANELPLELINLRLQVQTIPAAGCVPDTNDENIDFGDFIDGLDKIFSNIKTKFLRKVYGHLIIFSDCWGDSLSHTTGLSIWFPLHYLTFKRLYNYYKGLDWAQSKWLQFLNYFYGSDDVRPTPVLLKVKSPEANNNFELSWSNSFDLAPVSYYVVEAEDTTTLFQDGCEDLEAWNVVGFQLSSENPHTGSYSFFSGNWSNADNYIETINPISIDGLGLLTLYLNYDTEEMADSLIVLYGDFKDVFYGSSNGWLRRRSILPPGNFRLKICYHTNGSVNSGGCYIDDIRVENLDNGRFIAPSLIDNHLFIFNKLKGKYLYAVYPEDEYGNSGNLSNFVEVNIENYAVPYSNPNPFQKDCSIILDYPDTLDPTVEIFSISGRRIRKFLPQDIDEKKIYWDGKDQNNQDVGAGLYFVFLRAGSFKRVGKIARQ